MPRQVCRVLLLLALTGAVPGIGTAAERAAQPGRVFTDCRDCPQMVVVPAGTFSMPSGATPPQSHPVRIAHAFAVGRYEITRGEYAHFVAATGHATGDRCFVFRRVGTDGVGIFEWASGTSWREPGYFQSDRHPAVCVSWNDAHAYLDWLSAGTGHRYRLLSESEWAYAASAGTGQVAWWGADPAAACRYANSADQSFAQGFDSLRDFAPCRDGYAFTAPVGSYAPNAFGLYDLLGNAWEWTEDCGGGDFARAPVDGAPDLSGQCANRVRRSGSWYRTVDANRSALPAADWHGNGGFRVARDLP